MPNPLQEFGSIDLDFSSNPELAAEFPDNSKALLILGFELLHAKMWPMASISEQLQAYLNQGFDPAEAVGELDLVTDTLPFWKLEKNWYKLDSQHRPGERRHWNRHELRRVSGRHL
ncbi:hypothetical protein [Haloplanus salinarum]|uniref:hypothetical protein n=1 Tax=Haloplanus salinarum TaxID=1912324 RepID=UPI00214B8EF1|nr:hypothetical protein [Haloplanus salinarum]